MDEFITALYDLLKGMLLVECILLGITVACSCISKFKLRNKKEK